MKVVHVQWEDPAFAQSGWMQLVEFSDWAKKGIARSDSVGLLVYETDHLIILVQSIGETQVADAVKINRSAIKEIKEIGQVEISLDLSDLAG